MTDGEAGFDDSKWPIVTFRFSAHSSDDEWREFAAHVCACAKRGERFAFIADASMMLNQPNSTQRKIGADIVQTIAADRPAVWPIIAFGNVIKSALVRGALTAILWVAKPPHPNKVFSTWDEAYAWVSREVVRAQAGDLA